jgi:hypothetical protein
MEACLRKMEPCILGANSEETKSIAVYEEVSKEVAAVEMIRTLKDRHLAIRHHGQPKKRTQGSGGTRRSCREMTCCAIPAPHKGHVHQEPDRDKVSRGAPKGRMLERR